MKWTKKLPKEPGLYWCFTGRYKAFKNAVTIAQVYSLIDGKLAIRFFWQESDTCYLLDLPKRFPHYHFGERIRVPSVHDLDKNLKRRNKGGIGPYQIDPGMTPCIE